MARKMSSQQQRPPRRRRQRVFSLLIYIGIICLSQCVESVNAWDWWDEISTMAIGNRQVSSTTKTLSMEEVADMRVRDIKRRLARTHGYGADEIAKMLDKKELIQALAFEEHKVRQREWQELKRVFVWKAIFATIVIGFISFLWPVWKQLYDIALVNLVVYTDRKKYEARRCWDYQSVEGAFVVVLMAILDFLQIWLSLSVILSWVMTSKYFFPVPSIPVRPAAFMGGPVSQGPLAQYGINVGPMVITWILRFVHGRLETWCGKALLRSQKRQKKKQRAQETPDERAARKAAKRAAKQARFRQEQAQQERRQQQQEQSHNNDTEKHNENKHQQLSRNHTRQAAADAAEERQQQEVHVTTAFDDLD